MNGEEQAVDLCNVRMKASDEDRTTALISEELVLRNSTRIIDEDAGTPDSGHQEKRNKDEVPTRRNNGTILSMALNVPEECSVQDPESCFSVGSANGDEDMDIGVDLSLDESGVLESDPDLNPESSVVGSTDTVVSETEKDLDKRSEQHPLSSSDNEAPPTSLSSPMTLQEEPGPKPGAKRVTFPSDENIVSGSVEPKDPWRHAQNVTVEEILNAYRQACQKLNCKPVPKVLKQIQDLTDLTQRNECLDLKGEKLDYRACESLEEIFKRVQFKVVDLEQTNLDEDGASALFDMIEYYESATHLNISFNKHIGTRGWQAAAHMMRKTSSLQYLDARNTPLLDHSAPFVARALRISGSLTVLHLENAGLSGRPLMLLATALKMNMNLRELYLADNKINGLQDSAQLGNLLKFNYNIHILDLRNNHILDSGLAYICEGLKEQRKGLVTLVLWNNQLTHNGMGYLASALPCTQSLETLNLGHNAVGNEGVLKLKDGLIANRSLLRLGLASTKLSCEGAVALAEFFAESPRLLRLDLRENDIKTGGLMALSLALKVNTSLLRLDLDREPKKETVKSFIETQRTLLAEIQNGCKRNFVLAKEKEEIQQQMRQSVSMAEIATEVPPPEEEEDAGDEVSEEQKAELEEVEQEEEEEKSEKQSEVQEDEERSAAVQDDSDSDTDNEEDNDDIKETKSSAQTSTLNQTITPINTTLTACQTPPINIPSSTPESGIRVTEANVPSGTPSSPGRCFSVSSPGRGHKIFMVTRVESPPEQKQQKSDLIKCVQENNAHSESSSKQLSVSQDQHSAERTTSVQQTSEEPSQVSLESKSEATLSTTVELPSTHSQTQQETNLSPEPDKEATIVHTERCTLPNGLKPEFMLHLLEPEAHKAACYVMEHMSVTAELSCGQDLEELLLDASLDASRD
ncbi:protein phosphatase 1 regulatory subunit 37, partial [Silurus meridionalis]